MSSNPPTVSVIVSAYTIERAKDLFELLDSLQTQKYRDFEILIVIEKSEELLKSVKSYIGQKAYSNVHLLFNEGITGLSAARNLGVKHALGKIIAFIDDDAIAYPSWLQSIVDSYDDASVIGSTGPILPIWENEELKWLPQEFYWIISCVSIDSNRSFEVRNAWGTNMSFRKTAFDSAGLFSTNLGAKGGGTSGKNELIGEDTEFSLRVKAKTQRKIIYNPLAIVGHRAYEYRLKWRFVAKRAYWEGYTKAIFRREMHNLYAPDVLQPEKALLKRIIFRLFPSIIAGFASKPAKSWKKLRLTSTALGFVALGYCRGKFKRSIAEKVEACPEYS